MLGIVGPNGAGKTTLIKLCANLIKPSRGQILLDGNKISAGKIEKLGLLSIDSYLYSDLTVLENIKFYARMYKTTDERAGNYIEYFNLADFKDKTIKELSFGQKKRVSLARVMLGDPQILLMDEPFLGLDFEAINELVSLISDMKKQGKVVILATHQLDIAADIISKLMILKHGNLLHYDIFDSAISPLSLFYKKVLERSN